MFPLAGVPVGPESFFFHLCKYVPEIEGSIGPECLFFYVYMFPPHVFIVGGEFEVNWGNKTCQYVPKYFSVFLSI